MSLIKCSECGQDISDQAPNCPHCGYVFKQEPVNQTVSVNGVSDLNIEKIVKTGKTWKMLKLISWVGGVIGLFMALGSADGSFIKTFGWTLLVACIILFIIAKFGNWWERG